MTTYNPNHPSELAIRHLADEVRALDARLDDGTGDLWTICRQAIIDDKAVTAQDVAEIVRDARAEEV